MSKQGELTREIRAALVAHGPLSTTELSEYCLTALESRDISRAIGDLRRVNKIEVDPEIGSKTRDGRPAKRYRWVGQTVATHAETSATVIDAVHPIFSPCPDLTMKGGIFLSDNEVLMQDSVQVEKMTTDVTGEELSCILDYADEAMLAYADEALSEDPVWARLRVLSRHCHKALHDHRLARALTDKVG